MVPARFVFSARERMVMELDPTYLSQAARRMEELEREMAVPGVAAHPESFKELVREHQRLRDTVQTAGSWSACAGNWRITRSCCWRMAARTRSSRRLRWPKRRSWRRGFRGWRISSKC